MRFDAVIPQHLLDTRQVRFVDACFEHGLAFRPLDIGQGTQRGFNGVFIRHAGLIARLVRQRQLAITIPMAVESHGMDLLNVVALLGAGVVAVPIFRRLGLGSVLGYFTAGLAIGPFGFKLFRHPESILHVAEFGVIMLLFIIGLEMHPSRLWQARRQIFGLGVSQVLACGGLLTIAGMAFGLSAPVAFIAGMGFVLSSTAVIMQMLEERGEASTAMGQKAVSILLLEDLAIVPLLAIVAALAPGAEGAAPQSGTVLIGIAALVGLVIVGRFIINPMFRLLAAARAREVMTAAALLVVLGAAYLMELGGLSMAMGAFVAGVLLSESTFRHQLEADIEPFRGLLLGLFFLAIGMSLDLSVIGAQWTAIIGYVVLFMTAKALGIYAIARFFGDGRRDAVGRVALFTQGGEFAFVLYTAALGGGIFTAEQSAIFTAVVIFSMALTPLTSLVIHKLMPPEQPVLDGVEQPDGLEGNVLIVGFGRFGQVVSQPLLARGFDISIIEADVDMIRSASEFGFKVYYGDGTRLDVLKASGAAKAEAIIVCVDKREAADRIVALVQSEFPLTKLFVRAFDRGHAMDLIRRRVDVQVREMFESAMLFGEMALRELGVPDDAVVEIMEDTRRRDEERLELQVAGDIRSGLNLMRNNSPRPAPLTKPRKAIEAYNIEDGVAVPFTPLPSA